jgi:hypothetical protein
MLELDDYTVIVVQSRDLMMPRRLMGRNILAHKAPPNNEGYDLICIHPDSRHIPLPDDNPF